MAIKEGNDPSRNVESTSSEQDEMEHDPDGKDSHDQDGAIKPDGNTIR